MDVGVLGPLVVHDERGRIDIASRRARALLCWLALNANEPVSAASAVTVLWPGPAPTTAHTRVVHIARELSAALGNDAISTGRTLLLHIDPDRIDAERFRALADRADGDVAAGLPDAALQKLNAAVALWRGHPYPELDRALPAVGPIDRLTERYLDCLETINELRMAGSVDYRLLADIREQATLHPERVRLRCQLALVQYRCGRQGEALATLREVPSDTAEFDTARALQLAVLRHDPALLNAEFGRFGLPGVSS